MKTLGILQGDGFGKLLQNSRPFSYANVQFLFEKRGHF